jgi:outer membrane protein assembly factor BamB
MLHAKGFMKKSLFAILLVLAGISAWRCSGQQPGTLLWSYNAGNTITASPTLAPDGTIYITTYAGLYAITNAGSNKWTFPAGQNLSCSPTIGSDGTIYFGDGNANFRAINPDGSQKWMFALQPEFQYSVAYDSTPAIGPDGSIYFTASGRLYSFTSSGTKNWEHVVDDPSTPGSALSPILGNNGTIYVGSVYNRAFYALNPDGTEKWVFGLNNGAGESAAIGADGTVYVTGNYLYALSPLGTNLWSSDPLTFEGSSPVIGNDGTLYVEKGFDNSLWSIKPNGQTNWGIATGATFHGPLPTPPAIDSSGMLYYSASNTLFAVTPQGSISWIFAPDHSISSVSPCIGPDGTIYAAFGRTLYALKGTNAPASAPWPMYRQNLRHTGKVEKPALQAPKKRADANFQFQLAGEVGQTYTIQRSADLSLWSTFTNLVATNPPATFVDLSASNFNSNFYRAVLQ